MNDAIRRFREQRGLTQFDAEYDYLVTRARECILFGMSPEYYDSMTTKEHNAWIAAYNEINKRSA